MDGDEEKYRGPAGVGEPMEYRRVRFLRAKKQSWAKVQATVGLVIMLMTLPWARFVVGMADVGHWEWRSDRAEAVVMGAIGLWPLAAIYLTVRAMIVGRREERAYVMVAGMMTFVMLAVMGGCLGVWFGVMSRWPHVN